jgi:hypothetical protein
MGLDCSHDAFHGAYSAFHRFRTAVAEAAGGGWKDGPAGNLILGGVYEWDDEYDLMPFFDHSDCDGEISPQDCTKIADNIKKLLPKLDEMGEGGRHIARGGGYGAVARTFIAGCREAAKNNEPLYFV